MAMRVLEFWKSEAYRTALTTNKNEVASKIATRAVVIDDSVFLALPNVDQGVARVNEEPQTKLKTRGKAFIPEADVEVGPDPTVTLDLAAIQLPQSALAVFRKIFPTTPEERLEEVEWDAFVRSMGSAGFMAKNGGGSMVIFENKRDPGTIIFHRPHPHTKIDPIMLQSMGRRMNKWFHWKRETFKLAAK